MYILYQKKINDGSYDDKLLKLIEIARGAFNNMLKTIVAGTICLVTKRKS